LDKRRIIQSKGLPYLYSLPVSTPDKLDLPGLTTCCTYMHSILDSPATGVEERTPANGKVKGK
jgi:hypothetical protein